MDIEQAFTIVGEFGLFQIGIFVIIATACFPSNDVITANFIAYNVEHWCRIDSLTNLPFDLQKEIAIPKVIPPGGKAAVYSDCDMYDLNYSSYSLADFLHWDRSVVENASTVNCGAWVYDQSVMVSSIVGQYDTVCSNNWRTDLVSTITTAGLTTGAIVAGAASDKFGRRITFGASFLVKIFGALLTVINSYNVLLVGRFFQGMGSMAASQCGLVILLEFVGPSYRNIAGMGIAVIYSFGYMSLSVVGYFVRDYREYIYVWIGPIIVAPFVALILPESPRWLLIQGRPEDAIKVMRKVAVINNIDISETAGLDALTADDDSTDGDTKTSPLDLLRTPLIRLRTLVLCLAWFTSSLIFFALSLGAGSLGGDVFLNSLLLGAVEIPANLLCMWSIEQTWCGRRRASVVFFLIAGISSIICVPIIIAGTAEAMVIVLSMLGKAGSTAVLNLLFVYSAELYPTTLRNMGMGATNLFAGISGMAASYVGNSLRLVWQPLPVLLFGIFGTLAGVSCLLLPETLGLELADTVAQIEKRGHYESFAGPGEMRSPITHIGAGTPYSQDGQSDRPDAEDGEGATDSGPVGEHPDNSTDL